MEPEFVNESMWDDDDDGANNEETNFGEDDSNMEMTGFDGSATGDGNITGGGEGGAVGDAQVLLVKGRNGKDLLMLNGYTYYQHKVLRDGFRWSCTQMGSRSCRGFLHVTSEMMVVRAFTEHTHPPSTYLLKSTKKPMRIKNAASNEMVTKRASEREALNPLALKIASIQGRSNF